MRYQSTTGLHHDDILELVTRIHHILQGRRASLRRKRLGLYKQVVVTLILLRQNISQMTAADMFGISQPTISRIYRRTLPLLGRVLQFTGISLEEAVRQDHLVLVDGTYVPTGNRPAQGRDLEKANYSGKHRVQCLGIQVAATYHGELIAVSEPQSGARHDSRALEESGWAAILDHEHVSWIADSAYSKYSALTPIRKTTGRGRLDWEIIFNKVVASSRSPIGHAIGHLKQWKILATGYRGRLHELPETIAIFAKLELFRLGW